MKLSPIQVASLTRLLKYRAKPPSYGDGVPITIVGDQIVRGARWRDIDRVLKKAGYRDFKPPGADLGGTCRSRGPTGARLVRLSLTRRKMPVSL